MKKDTFQHKLKLFFQRHDPMRSSLADRIARKFQGYEKIVFNHLNKIYGVTGTATDGHDEIKEDNTFGGPAMGANTGAVPY